MQASRRGVLKGIGTLSVGAVGGSGASLLTGGSTTQGSASRGQPGDFVGTWTASPSGPDSSGISQAGFTNQTLRMMTRTSVGGDGVRIRLANTFGDDPVVFERATIGIRQADGSAAVESGTLRELTFGGDASISIPSGARVLSDTVALKVEPEQDLVVSLYAADATGPTTWHALGTKTSYVADGDATTDVDGGAFDPELTNWFFLEGIEVVAPETKGSIACLGNSITDGFASTVDGDATYPDFLAERVNERNSLKKSVLNAGISGNRVRSDDAGPNALSRFDRDVLTQPQVTDVLLLEGINDIGFSAGGFGREVSAAAIIDGYEQLVARAHTHDVRMIGGTLLPYKGAGYYSEAGEEKRQQINEYIRESGTFDGVVDFDRALRDPDNPLKLLPKYDSGDNLHPNDTGYKKMAETVDLTLFQGQSRGRSQGRGPPASVDSVIADD